MEKEYTYGVARIRALESSLFTDEMIDQLIACKSYEEGLEFIKSKGYGDSSHELSLDEIMRIEKEKVFRILSEIVDDSEEYAILTLQDEYHNLKAAIKQVCTEQETENVFIDGVGESPDSLKALLKDGRYESLPHGMEVAAKEAMETLLRTGDGQLCDIIIDKAALQAIKNYGESSDNELIREYADILVTMADIKITLRAVRSGKDEQFLENALVMCRGVSISELKNAAVSGFDAVCSYLESIGYDEGVKALKVSASVFECWCDNQIIEEIKSQKYQAFTIGPIIAYAVARLNEIKTVKIILLGLQNGFDEEFIKERVRQMYA